MGYDKLLGVLKHLQGQHDQASHGRGRGKGTISDSSTPLEGSRAGEIVSSKYSWGKLV